ncbi:desulfoferrodoxin [archaeon]|nr:desulfoferrodoxin [archaeon]
MSEIHTIDEEGNEKHVPVIEKTENGIKIKVGSVPHPMEEEHYIQWIEIESDGKKQKKDLNPGDLPEAEFKTTENVIAFAMCNVHGIWKS